MPLSLFATKIEQNDAIIKYLSNVISKVVSKQNVITIAVSGGKSPIELFHKLSNTDLAWDQINIVLVDERITATNNVDSNEYLVKNHLLINKASKTNFVGLCYNNQKLAYMLSKAQTLEATIDCAILGMGEDGHMASIFPECKEFAAAINTDSCPAYIETNPISAKYQRIGLNLSSLIRIKHLILNINNETKLKIVKEAMVNTDSDYPIAYLMRLRPDMQIFWSV